MDQPQQKALNALEPFILLSKSANSPRAAANLVTQAISAPNTFVFAELLQTPNIQSLQTASEEHARYLTLLQIFAWGTWSDYTGKPSSIPQVPWNNILKPLPSKRQPPQTLLAPRNQAPPTLPPLPLHIPHKLNLHPPPLSPRPAHSPRPRRPRNIHNLRRTPKRKTRHPLPTRGRLLRRSPSRSETRLHTHHGIYVRELG